MPYMDYVTDIILNSVKPSESLALGWSAMSNDRLLIVANILRLVRKYLYQIASQFFSFVFLTSSFKSSFS